MSNLKVILQLLKVDLEGNTRKSIYVNLVRVTAIIIFSNDILFSDFFIDKWLNCHDLRVNTHASVPHKLQQIHLP